MADLPGGSRPATQQWRWRPFIEWRREEIGVGASFSFGRSQVYEKWAGDARTEWVPDIWLHIGPLVMGIGYEWNGGGVRV